MECDLMPLTIQPADLQLLEQLLDVRNEVAEVCRHHRRPTLMANLFLAVLDRDKARRPPIPRFEARHRHPPS